MQTIYIEKSVLNHPRAHRIVEKIKPFHVIECNHYKEVFNPKNQNFRLQKKNPALILAKKEGNRVMASPPGFGIGGSVNYYFSHMLNCLYDCRYCFLQGMYSSANYVVFLNYEDFMEDIAALEKSESQPVYFFSGYDCDSLAFEPVTEFIKEFLPFFSTLEKSILELRTKSTNVRELLQHPSHSRCVVAFSFTPEDISREVEHGVPSVMKRINAMKKAAEHGWPIGLRFDPLIYHVNFKTIYKDLIDQIFSVLPPTSLHSVSTGALRFPSRMHAKITSLYPNDPLFAQPFDHRGKVISYPLDLEESLKNWVVNCLKQHINDALIFECQT